MFRGTTQKRLKMRESQIERTVCLQAFLRWGIESVKLSPDRTTGYPDRLFWIPGGCPLLIEFKAPSGIVTPKQAWVHDRLRRLGYQVEVCRSMAEGLAVLSARINGAAS